jgi:hypothetical protein
MSSGGKKQATSTTINSDAPPEWARAVLQAEPRHRRQFDC